MSKLYFQPRVIFVAYFVAIALISSLPSAHGFYVQINPSMQDLAAQYQQTIHQQQQTRQYTQSQINYIKSLFQRLTLGTLGEEQREEIEDFFDQYNEGVQQQNEQQQQLVEQQQNEYEQQTQKYPQQEEDDDEQKQEQQTQQPQYEQQTQVYPKQEEDDDDEKKEEEQQLQTQQPQYEQQTQVYPQQEEEEDDDDDDEKKQEHQLQTQQPQYEQQTQKYEPQEEEDDDDDDEKKKEEEQTQQPQEQQTYEQQTEKYQQQVEEDDSQEDDCGGYKAFPGNPAFYLQFDGVNWLKRPCPAGLGFAVEKCACVIRIPNYITPGTTPATTTTTKRTSTTSTTPSTTTRSTTTSTTTTPEPTTTRRTTTTSTTPQPTTTRTTTTGKPSLDLCKDCVMLHGVGYAPYPGHCDAYIQCRYYGDVPSSVNIRHCTGGLQWNQDKLTCDYPENVKCQSVVVKCPNQKAVVGDSQGYLVFNGYSWSQLSCPPNKVYSDVTCDCVEKRGVEVYFETCLDKKPIPNDRTGFLQLSPSGWIRMPCPRTLGYNAQTCRCTDYLDTDNQYTLCPNLKPIPGDKTGYLQFNGVSWLRMPCPATVGYSPRTCQCSDYLTDDDDKSESIDKDDDVCKPALSLTFDDNSATDLSHNQFWINNTGVTFRNGKAHFDGSSRLTVPGFSNMDLGDTVFIAVKYNQSGYGKQTIVTNGDCGVLQSLGVCSDSESVDFFVDTGAQQAKVLVPKMINSWQYVMYSLYKDHLKGHVGTRSYTHEVKGSVARRQRGLIIGGGGECGGFTGVIDEIHVFLCYNGYA